MLDLSRLEKLSFEELKKYLLENPNEVNIDIDGEGGRILDYAGWWNYYELAYFLITELKVDIHRQDKDGTTALYTTICAGVDSIDIAKLLLDNGANINEKDNEGGSLLHLAVSGISIECPEDKNLKMLNFLVENGAEINVQNNKGDTPLHLAIEAITERCLNDMKMVELLLKLGASINIKNNKGISSLDMVIKNNNIKIIKNFK